MDYQERNVCGNCYGNGDVPKDGNMAYLETCHVCHGTGSVVVLCEFDECEELQTEQRGPMCYCAKHAMEHDALVVGGKG